MVCYHPYEMWPPAGGGRWLPAAGLSYPGAVSNKFNCDRCQGCRARRTAEWTARLMLEARYYDAPVLFVTLTFADEHLPVNFSVSLRDIQLFMKRVRKRFGKGVRFFAIGEYGSREDGTRRPHYHFILYNLPLNDLCDEGRSSSGFACWRSPSLEACWDQGFVSVGKADRASMSYVAGYHFKKLGGAVAASHYTRIHSVTGEVCQVQPEFATRSTHPGIGLRWAEEFCASDLQHDDIVIDGRRRGMPGYLKRKRYEWLPDDGPFGDAFMKKLAASCEAKARARLQAADLTPQRLADREELHRLRTMAYARGGDV